MGLKKVSTFLFFFFFVIATAHKNHLQSHEPCKHIVLYYHDIIFNGTNTANATAVAAANETHLGNFNFGLLVVFDDPMTKDHHLLSPPAARAQGFFFYDMKTTFNAWFAFTLLFNSSQYKGTLNLMGADMMDEETRDISVVGGTGDFLTRDKAEIGLLILA